MVDEGTIKTAAAVGHFLKAFGPDVVRFAKDLYGKAASVLLGSLEKQFTQYTEHLIQRHSQLKSFFIHDKPTSLYSFYEPMAVKIGKALIDSPSAPELFSFSRCITIMGTGGGGKSILMRHLLLSTLRSHTKIPIFIELRQLNGSSENIETAILRSLTDGGVDYKPAIFKSALAAGQFAIFLDGMDELIPEKHDIISKQIQSLSEMYHKCQIVVSSRPDRDLGGWSHFAVADIQSLTLDQAVSLINKLPTDKDLQNRFTTQLKEGLFSKHSTFLSNPLLLSIMLMTYDQGGHIPDRLNLFYSSAYEALFDRHDARKGGFRRKRRTSLDVDQFARVFSAFCLRTYDKSALRFTASSAREHIELSKKITGIEFHTDAFIDDAMKAVCLLLEDGLELTFTHRSFQEYFVARFISQYAQREKQIDLLKRFSSRVRHDSVLYLLYELRPELVEAEYILPAIDEAIASIGVKRKVGMTHYIRWLSSNFNEIRFSSGRATATHRGTTSRFDSFVFSIRTLGHLVDFHPKSSAPNRFQKWDDLAIVLEEATSRNAALRDLSVSENLFSLAALQAYIDLGTEIRSRHKAATKSIDQILFG